MCERDESVGGGGGGVIVTRFRTFYWILENPELPRSPTPDPPSLVEGGAESTAFFAECLRKLREVCM